MVEGEKSSGWIDWTSSAKRKRLTETLEITYNLFLDGKSIKEIANERGFKEESIERQIIELITKSLINVDDVIDVKKKEFILEVINNNSTTKLSEIKNGLPGDYTWFEIKSVLAYLASIDMPRVKK